MSSGKLAVLGLWVVLSASFLVPADSAFAWWGQMFFWLTWAAHAAECGIFYNKAKASKGSLAGNLAQIFLFGLFHVQELEPA